jgi:tetratricopeptide (TPR) repeat protein
MARDDWYRNTTWNDEIEANFQQRLRRARDKPQYLRIQANCLTATHPRVTLRLLDEYFSLGDHFDIAQAHMCKAQAQLTLNDMEGAIASYEAALEREGVYPSLKTQAYLDFVCLVVNRQIEPLYYRALEVLDSHSDRPIFSSDRYRANGACAILLRHFGQTREAREAANLAMAAARETQSGFRYHQKVGLVKHIDDAFGNRVAALAD